MTIIRQMEDLYESCMNGAADSNCAAWNKAIDKCIEIATLGLNEQEDINTWRTDAPTKTGRYLVYYHEVSDGTWLPEFDTRRIRIMIYRVDKGWIYPTRIPREANSCITTEEVTHWMPLPKEPMTDGTNAARRSNAPGSQDTKNVQAKD